MNNFDKEIDTVEYDKQKSGVSYARNDFGKWQWTTTVTKNLLNVITPMASNSQDTSSETGKTTVAGIENKQLVNTPQPLPSWVLAVIGVSAVCYAAYEYRFEARNYFYKLRANR